MRFTTLGVGAQASPVYAPAGLLVTHRGCRVMLDGGPGALPAGRLDAWLVCDDRSELRAELRRLCAAKNLLAGVRPFECGAISFIPRRVVHTSHPTYGYVIREAATKIVWAPEFFRFPAWAKDADLMFAEAASWNRPIHFAGGVGGHMSVLAVAKAAARANVRRLVFAHIGRPTLRALSGGMSAPQGEFARDGQMFYVRSRAGTGCS